MVNKRVCVGGWVGVFADRQIERERGTLREKEGDARYKLSSCISERTLNRKRCHVA